MEKEAVYIQEVLDGNTARFSWFVENYKNMAFSIASSLLGNDQDAEEAVQDAFLQAFRSLRSFKGEARFSTWLYRIVVNGSLNRLKKRKRPERHYEDIELAADRLEAVESTYKQLNAQEQTRLINAALAQLQPEDRLILTLYYLDEQSLTEIAIVIGIAKENVKMRLYRARAKMYGRLSKILNTEINVLKHDRG